MDYTEHFTFVLCVSLWVAARTMLLPLSPLLSSVSPVTLRHPGCEFGDINLDMIHFILQQKMYVQELDC